MIKNKEDLKNNWDDLPEWSSDQFKRAEIADNGSIIRHNTGTLTKRGRPQLENPKQQVTLRLDKIIVEKFKADGAGWQTRINQELRKIIGV